MRTSFFRFALGFLGIVALALALVFVLGVVGSHDTGNAKAPSAVGAATQE